MKVPYFDLKTQYSVIQEEILEALSQVCNDTAFILGESVAKFEKEFAVYCEAKHCVAVNSGTSALHLALLAAGIKSGDEVITVPNTFIATVEPISYCGATPVFVDIDPRTANMDPAAVKAAITPRTKAILPVHLYGRPANLDPIMDLAQKHGLSVIEDACQAHGARYRGKRVGSIGHAAAFSFYPGKNLGAYGEGGALITNDDAVAELARSLRSHGETTRYEHSHIGYNYRMDGFQGAVLRIKLKHLEEWTAQRQKLAAHYRELLAGTVDLPQDDPRDECVYHLFVVYVKNRDDVRTALEAKGIGTGIHYPTPIHLQQAYAGLGHKRGSFPHSESSCDRALSMPIFPEMTTEQVNYSAKVLIEIVRQ